jgi:hypothetical protein
MLQALGDTRTIHLSYRIDFAQGICRDLGIAGGGRER